MNPLLQGNLSMKSKKTHYEELKKYIENSQKADLENYLQEYHQELDINYRPKQNLPFSISNSQGEMIPVATRQVVNKTLLYIAIEKNNRPAMILLLRYGADPHLRYSIRQKTLINQNDESLEAEHYNILMDQSAFDLAVERNINSLMIWKYYGWAQIEKGSKIEPNAKKILETLASPNPFPFNVFKVLYQYQFFPKDLIQTTYSKLLERNLYPYYADFLEQKDPSLKEIKLKMQKKKEEEFGQLHKEFKCFLDEKNYEEAIKSYQRLETYGEAFNKQKENEIVLDIISCHKKLADRYRRKKQYSDALDSYRNSIKLCKKFEYEFIPEVKQKLHKDIAFCYTQLAEFSLENDDYTQALAFIKQSYNYNTENAEAYAKQAFCEIEISDNYEGAIEALTRAINLNNEESLYYLRRGESYLKLEKTTACFNDFYAALAILSPHEMREDNFKNKRKEYYGYIFNALDGHIAGFLEDSANESFNHYPELIKFASKELHYKEAQYLLGKMLWEGMLIPKDEFLSLKWLALSAKQNYAPAQYLLSQLLIHGVGIESSRQDQSFWLGQAKILLEQAAQLNHEESKQFWARFYYAIATSMDSNIPIIGTDEQHSLFTKLVQEMQLPPLPPSTLKRKHEENPLDLTIDHKNFTKRLRIKDNTTLFASLVENQAQSAENEDRNNIAASLTLIFSPPLSNEEKAKGHSEVRMHRMIPIYVPGRDIVNVEQVMAHSNWEEKFRKNFSQRIKKGKAILGDSITQGIGNLDQNFLDLPSKVHPQYGKSKSLHSEQALYEYLNDSNHVTELVKKFIRTHTETFEKGAKVCGVVLDIYSNFTMCSHCQISTIMVQNSFRKEKLSSSNSRSQQEYTTPFLFHLIQELKKSGYEIHKKKNPLNESQGKDHLHMATRVRASKACASQDRPLIDTLPNSQNLQDLDNMAILQVKTPFVEKENDRFSAKVTLFQSGSSASRERY